MSGRAVVGMFNEIVEPLVLCKVVEFCGVKAHEAPAGRFEHDKLMLDEYKGCGVSCTV